MANTHTVITETKDKEILLSRFFDAPRELVYRALTDPVHVAQWWGPHGFTNRVEMDLRPGGAYRFVMCGGDGTEYPMRGKFLEVVKNERISFSVDLEEHPQSWKDMLSDYLGQPVGAFALRSSITMSLEEHKNKTKLTIATHFEADTVRDAYLKMGMEAGWTESLKRLQDQLSKTNPITHA